jgi:molybdate transport system permease protein
LRKNFEAHPAYNQSLRCFPISAASTGARSIATVLSLGIGLAAGWALTRWQFRGKNLAEALVTAPIVLPPTVLGYYLLVLLGRSSPLGELYESLFGGPLVFTWQAAVAAASLHAIPLLIRSARAAFEGVSRNLENAARSLGASEWRVFFRVTLPLSKGPVAAAAVFAFARALGDFGVTIPGKTQTMAVAIYDAVQSGQSQLAMALVIVMSALAIVVLYAIGKAGEGRVL